MGRLGLAIALVLFACSSDTTSPFPPGTPQTVPVTRWTLVDSGGSMGINLDPTDAARNPFLAVHSSKVYAAWDEVNGAVRQIRVKVYDGDDGAPTWTAVDASAA